MKKLVFATHNLHKLREIQEIIGDTYQVIGLNELGLHEEIPETADTLEGNAQIKAEYIYEKLGMDCFSDDTGLEIEALNGAPGVYSARFAGEGCTFQDNIKKTLQLLDGVSNRKACFRSVICLIMNGERHFFEGRVDGKIIDVQRGTEGFGYDPIFIPDGFSKTFAEMPLEEKNGISHRGIATQRLIAFLFENFMQL
ncbi:MAG: non-canonical purine NTP diphosphatase [Bacteroidales bacterium]|nr:non-canonical purine NTP diphosphatase [Bacteroidales bacterium]